MTEGKRTNKLACKLMLFSLYEREASSGWLDVTVCCHISSNPRFGSSRGGPPAGKKFGNPGDRLRKKRWDLNELPKFEKNFYNEHPEVERMSQVMSHSDLQLHLLC